MPGYCEVVCAARFPRQPYRWSDWTPETLLELKRSRGTTVSLVLPARDEQATVGGIVSRVRENLVQKVPLVDEVVVIDSDSADATADRARRAGATVHAATAVRPDLGVRRGKGEAMWKSLFVTSGDVLVFIDADLTEWDTHFVTGLLGPLLTGEEVALVKGCYERPRGGDPRRPDEAPAEGGRVTELVARPLLALHWPELADIVQPLAGEWAVRRSVLEQLPVPTGYAVELAVLVDTLAAHGPHAIAQVDLGVREHGHQGLHDLGAMALQIQAMVESRVTGRTLADHLPMRQFDWTTGTASPVVRDVDLRERPPAVTVPEYHAGAAGRGVSTC